MTSEVELSRARSVPIPARMQGLPLDPVRRVPVPWFVDWLDGKPEFRVMDARKRDRAIEEQLCWVCGQRNTPPSVFVVGPMCGINRITAEPPMHAECADYALQACPFLTRPRMERRELSADLQAQVHCPGQMIARNPGCMARWVTSGYRTVSDGWGGWLIDVGDPLAVTWHAEGRSATRAEVLTSILTGLPLLMKDAWGDSAAWEELARCFLLLDPFLPKE